MPRKCWRTYTKTLRPSDRKVVFAYAKYDCRPVTLGAEGSGLSTEAAEPQEEVLSMVNEVHVTQRVDTPLDTRNLGLFDAGLFVESDSRHRACRVVQGRADEADTGCLNGLVPRENRLQGRFLSGCGTHAQPLSTCKYQKSSVEV